MAPVDFNEAGPSDKGKAKFNWKNGPPSCKECVRLKLKCSRSWPCTSCVRRGCANICPSGTMPGRTTKDQAMVAKLKKENEKLRHQIERMQAQPQGQSYDWGRSALNAPSESSETNRTREYMPFSAAPEHAARVPSGQRDDNFLDTASRPGPGVLEEGSEGQKYLGRGAGTLFVCEDDESSNPTLVFPFVASDRAVLGGVHELFPPVEQALELLQVYDDQVEWMYRPADRPAISAVLESIYSAPSLKEQIHHVPPHRLASVLMILALGLSFLGRPMTQTIPLFNAASALLCVPERHFMVRHSLASVETLHMMVSYLLGLPHSDGPKAAWQILGLCVRTAGSIGLHRDSEQWGLSSEQQALRAQLWWECVTYDILQCLNFGRPYSVPRQLYDAPMPEMPPDGGATPHDSVFHVFKYRLGQAFVHIADYLANSELPDYSTVMRIDAELRRVEAGAPAWLKWSDFGEDGSESNKLNTKHFIQQHSATMFFNKGLLMLHRPSFFKAVSAGTEPLLGQYAASFTTCVTSARKHTRLIASLLKKCPQAAYGWWYWVFHAYTAAVIQHTVLRRVPESMMADDVRADFQASHDIIEQMAEHSGVARRALPMLEQLYSRIQQSHPKRRQESSSETPDAPTEASSTFDPTLDSLLTTNNFYDPTQYRAAVPASMDGLLGFEYPVSNGPEPLADPLIQTLLYWNVIANNEQNPPGFGDPQSAAPQL
ncbi:hypothetical protein CcaverHIS631_0504830 [Cutaneotrichosporon cavernicola]|nr:hypothetical protein CcaverHIS631_0504830 [Cutaneotrichosporon cavernicola]BEJ08393.1 hypothetical protein CcaverHIS641_0504780 [Cutaneotrichosporon cavernicola]